MQTTDRDFRGKQGQRPQLVIETEANRSLKVISTSPTYQAELTRKAALIVVKKVRVSAVTSVMIRLSPTAVNQGER